MSICPNCDSGKIVKNGHIHNGKQRFKCNEWVVMQAMKTLEKRYKELKAELAKMKKQ